MSGWGRHQSDYQGAPLGIRPAAAGINDQTGEIGLAAAAAKAASLVWRARILVDLAVKIVRLGL